MGLLLAVFVCGFGFYDNRDSRIFNAFALTARMDNAQLHPGCRCALPWVNQEQFHFGYIKLYTLQNKAAALCLCRTAALSLPAVAVSRSIRHRRSM